MARILFNCRKTKIKAIIWPVTDNWANQKEKRNRLGGKRKKKKSGLVLILFLIDWLIWVEQVLKLVKGKSTLHSWKRRYDNSAEFSGYMQGRNNLQ